MIHVTNRLKPFSLTSRWVLALLVTGLLLASLSLNAQNIVSGEITGTVTDATGAVVANAPLTLTNTDLGVKMNTTTSATGSFRFPLLRPATYQLTISAQGFAKYTRGVIVNVGQVTGVNVQLSVTSKTEVVEVTGETPLLQAENANMATTLDSKAVENTPNSGGDMTNYALYTPGVVVSNGGGYGNFTSNGIGGMSNLYTINGNDYNDAYLNLNNSGASNMLLGANEVQEVSVVTNGYTGQYGRMAGSSLNYTTKSGSNTFHGTANWLWNGTILNANDYFNKNDPATAVDRPHAVSNQWAGSFGGPIVKNKVFFFYDNEGIRYVLPSGGPIYIPSPQYQTATLANLGAVSPGSVPLYTQAFNVWNKASGASRAVPVTAADDPQLGCGDIYNVDDNGNPISTNLASIPLGTPCALKFQDSTNNLNTERLMSLRVDVNVGDKDRLNFRYKQDRGVQATGTDPINSAFSANSVQPEDDGQVTWTRVFNDHMVNQFIASGLYYSAIFGPPNFSAATSVFPTTWYFNDGLFWSGSSTGLGNFSNYPQGRNVTQYQFVDDFSWTKGSHGLKFGMNFRRNDISDFSGSPNLTGTNTFNSMYSFTNGQIGSMLLPDGETTTNAGTFSQNFSVAPSFPVAYYSLGFYLQDEWAVTHDLKLTIAARFDRNSNMVCQKNCFARPNAGFQQMGHDVSVPYNQTIQQVTQAFPNLETIVFAPRLGVAWNPWGDQKTVIRGGIGIFSDLYPGLLGSRVLTNLPNVTSFTITSGAASPDVADNVWDQASANNSILQTAYANGGTLAGIRAVLPSFTPPNLVTMGSEVKNPKYLKWNFEIQRELDQKTSLSLNYVGNHGYDLFLQQRGLNTYCTAARCPGGFESLPATSPDPRFSQDRQYENGGVANYNGLTVSVVRRLTKGFTGSFNYTWSHTLDDLYEGGIEPLNNLANPSLTTVINPYNVKQYNYGSADQDIRHAMNANFTWEFPFKSSNGALNQLIGGWVWSGSFLANGGTPFSIYYTSISTGVFTNGSNTRVLGYQIADAPASCTAPSAEPCYTRSMFKYGTGATVHQNVWGSTSRNSYRGPGYFDSDMSLTKNFKVTERFIASIGATAYNIFNHPNFDRPTGSLSSALFGTIWETVGQPNSPYGNFQGAAVNGRILQMNLKVRF